MRKGDANIPQTNNTRESYSPSGNWIGSESSQHGNSGVSRKDRQS